MVQIESLVELNEGHRRTPRIGAALIKKLDIALEKADLRTHHSRGSSARRVDRPDLPGCQGLLELEIRVAWALESSVTPP
jgi:hypothetical protein